MLGAKRSAAEPMALARAYVSLALMAAAALGFVAPLALGSAAATQRDAALARAADFYSQHPYLEAPLELMLDAEDGPAGLAAMAVEPELAAREQAELDAMLAEVDASERALPAHRFGLTRGAVTAASLALHALLHASWLHLLWNLGLLASAGARLELRLGRARYGALLFAASAAGALLQLAASADGAAPLVGLSAATAGIAGAFAVRPGDVANDPLAVGRARVRRSPIRVAAVAGAIGCALAALLGASSLGFSPLALLGGFALGALAMFACVRAGWVKDADGAPLAREVAQALALLDAGDAPGALELLRRRLAAADDPQAARAFGLALRGRADAPEAFSRELLAAIGAKRRAAATALWRELGAQGAAPPQASAALHQLAAWLRSAGELGEARAAALASLAGADAQLAARLAKEARRGDPVFALRAAEHALATPGLDGGERKALEDLRAQALKDARNAGVVALDAASEAHSEAAVPAPPAARPPHAGATPPREEQEDLASLVGDDGALDPESLASEAGGPGAQEAAPESLGSGADAPVHDANHAFFERGAIDLAAEEPAPELPDPEVSGGEALLDALHQALTADGVFDGADASFGEAPELLADRPPDAAALTTNGQRGTRSPQPGAFERTSVSREAAPPAQRVAAFGSAASPGPDPSPSPDDFAFGAAADALFEEPAPNPASLRPLRVSNARPERLGREAIVIDVEGRGRAKLAYAKIDAVAAAGVKGLSGSGKAVLLIDLAIGFAAGEGELRVVRLRADGFDPRALVPGHSSPLAALRALVTELRSRTRGAALPRESTENAPFRIYADVATYEREAFGAERK